MKEDELLSINVAIAENIFSLKIPRKDEERFRKAAKQVNDKFITYQQKYPNMLHAKIFAMVAFEFATEFLKMEGQTDMEPFVKKVESMDKLLEDFLSQSEK